MPYRQYDTAITSDVLDIAITSDVLVAIDRLVRIQPTIGRSPRAGSMPTSEPCRVVIYHAKTLLSGHGHTAYSKTRLCSIQRCKYRVKVLHVGDLHLMRVCCVIWVQKRVHPHNVFFFLTWIVYFFLSHFPIVYQLKRQYLANFRHLARI
jgi:hypothetical protein